jgi:outer membrane protein
MEDQRLTGTRARWLAPAIVPLLVALSGCVSSLPGPTPAGPASVMALEALPARATAAPVIPPELLAPGASFALADVVTVALANSPLTRTTYLQARAAAAQLGAKRAPYLPSVDVSASVTRADQAAIGGPESSPYTVWGPALSLNYLLFDFGGRAANVADARWGLIAADWSHNANVQSVVFTVQQAYYLYLNSKALLEAARISVKQARAALDAATGRHDAGVATIAEVLQAKTALSQAELNLQTIDGQVLAFRGALATAMGLPANIPFDVGSLPGEVPLERASASVEALIEAARAKRPDLAASRALEQKAAAKIRSVRSEGLPSLSLSASGSRSTYDFGVATSWANSWSARALVSFPLFTGYANSYNLAKAGEDAAVAQAQADALDQQVILQVWTSYYSLSTATQRVRTSRDLLASAEQSERVALGRYREGVGTILDVLTAQSALANARAQEIQARSDWFVAVARLARDTGAIGPLDAKVTLTQENTR